MNTINKFTPCTVKLFTRDYLRICRRWSSWSELRRRMVALVMTLSVHQYISTFYK